MHRKKHFQKLITVLMLVTSYLNRKLAAEANLIIREHVSYNLNTLLNVFGQQKCFVLLDNHLKIDMVPLNFPVTTRLLGTINCKRNTTNLFYPSKTDLINKRIYRFPKFCSRIDLFKISSRIKPWNCQVQTQLYPDLSLFYILAIQYPKIFFYKISISSSFWEFMEPSIIPQVNVLVLEKPSLKLLSLSDSATRSNKLIAFQHWISNVVINDHKLDNNAPYLNTHLFIVAYTSPIANKLESKITSLLRVENCGFCKSSVFGNPALKTHTLGFDFFSSNIFKLIKASETTNTFWAFKQSEYNDKDDRIINGITNHLRMCDNYLLNPKTSYKGSLKSLPSIPFETLQNRLFHALANLVQVSLTNYTYNHFKKHICVNGKIIRRYNYFDFNVPSKLVVKQVHSMLSNYQILSLPQNVTNLRFISCGGSRGKQPIPFYELVGVYDRYIWACIILSNLAITCIFHKIYSQNLSFNKHFLNTLCLMLEQNDKLFECVISKANIRFTFGCFSLATLVLSYAYRSENVYNITKLRKSIPYERFQELIDNNFTIYVRSSYIYFDALSLFHSTRGAFPNLTAVSPHFLAYSPELIHKLSVTSELYEIEKGITQYNETLNLLLSNLVSNTRLHPRLESIVTSTFYPATNYTSRLELGSVGVLRDTAWILEHNQLQKFLLNCNKSALVISEDLANKFGRDLQLNNKPDVYIGKEVYSGVSLSLIFRGWIQPIVLRRMKLIKESGMWDWWPKFILSSKNFVNDTSYGKK